MSFDSKIKNILAKQNITLEDYSVLLAPEALRYIEPMAQKARDITLRHFGKSVLMYAPLYLSNYCVNTCPYCSFNARGKLKRKQLALDEVKAEAQAIASGGIRHILALTGDDDKTATLDYILSCVEILKKYFSAVGVEVYAMSCEGYRKLVNAGVDSLTIYQETYDKALYKHLHGEGPKKDYKFRFDAPERALRAGMRVVNIGALLGLSKNFRQDAFLTGKHAKCLQDKFLDAEISVSFPRMCAGVSNFKAAEITDAELVQMITAFRIFMPRAGITLSTRERAGFRDNVLGLGITKMSAGCETSVGGYSGKGGTGQFEMADKRSVAEIKKAMLKRGIQPVFKNWDIL